MRLIEVAARERDVEPVNGRQPLDVCEDFVEAADPAERFWGKSDLIAKQLPKASRRDADYRRDQGGLRRSGAQGGDGRAADPQGVPARAACGRRRAGPA